MKLRAFVLTTLLMTEVFSAESTLANCKTYARLFRNTCTQAPDGPATTASFATATTSCNQEGCPLNGGTAPNCAWQRKLCVSCTQENSKVYMRVQSNGLPDHCYGGRPNVTETNFDVKFIFNQDTTSLTKKTFASQTDFDSFMC